MRNILLIMAALAVIPAYAGNLVLRIRAINPKSTAQEVPIRSNLPAGILPEHIADLNEDLQIDYDIRNDIYYVHGKVEVAATNVAEYNVTIKDVWVVDPEEIKMLREKADELLKKLEGSKSAELAGKARDQVLLALEAMEKNQAANTIKRNNAIEHINAYESNMEKMERVLKDVGHLENLVLSAGFDPGELVGEDKTAAPPDRDVRIAAEDFQTAIVKITVRNTSPYETRKIPLKNPLPLEIRPDDVFVDPEDGLRVGVDPETGVTHIMKAEVEVPPTNVVTFQVKIRDKWNVSKPRIPIIMESATNILAKLNMDETDKYLKIREALSRYVDELSTIEDEKGPETLNSDYVAFYREQAKRLDTLESKINRIQAALRPKSKETKYGFQAKPPTMKTTWRIIYIILGFLAGMSLLFFLRWYGKTKAEKMDE